MLHLGLCVMNCVILLLSPFVVAGAFKKDKTRFTWMFYITSTISG